MISSDNRNTLARTRMPEFAFLDRNTRIPLERSASGNQRSIITLAKEKGLQSDFPLMLPSMAKLQAANRSVMLTRTVSENSVNENETAEVERPMPETVLRTAMSLPSLPFRCTAESETEEEDSHETPQAFIHAHFSQENQDAFAASQRKTIGIRRKRAALLQEALNHFDPQERSSVPSYAGNPMSPMFVTLPEPEPAAASQSTTTTVSFAKAAGAPTTPKFVRPTVEEDKGGSDASIEASPMRNIERLASKSRLSRQAKAA